MCYFKFLNTTTFYYINLFNITCPPSPEFPFYSKKGPKKKKHTHTKKEWYDYEAADNKSNCLPTKID